MKTLGLDSSISRVTSRELLRDCRSTAAILTYSLAGVRTFRERPAFTSTVGVTLLVPRSHIKGKVHPRTGHEGAEGE